MTKLSYNLILLSITTFFFEVFPYLIYGFNRILPSPWNSWPDIVDMILWMPATVLILINMFEYIIRPLDLKIRALYISGIVVYIWGHGVHWAANSLDVTPCNIPAAYFLDEIFGHGVLFFGFLITLIILAFLSPIIKEDVRGGYITMSLSAFLFAFSCSAMALEGQVVKMFLTASFIIFIYLLYSEFKYRLRSKSSIFFLTWSISLLALLIGYYFIMGGFIQPSEWM